MENTISPNSSSSRFTSTSSPKTIWLVTAKGATESPFMEALPRHSPGNESTRCRRGDHHCRTWAIPHQRQGTKTIPSLSFLQGDGGGVREKRASSTVFNDTLLHALGGMRGNGGRQPSPGLPPPGRIIPAGHLAHSLHRHAVEQRSEGKRLRLLRRSRFV